MSKERLRDLTLTGVVAALYVALTLVNPLSYGVFQFRISGILSVLPFLDRKFTPALLLGVAIANLFSSLGVIDVACGLLIGVIAYYGIILIKNVYIDCILYCITAGIVVGAELYFVAQAPFIMSFFSVAASMLVVMFIGIPVDKMVLKQINK